MKDSNIDAFLENKSLKNEFVIRDLDLSYVFCETPDDLERENDFLRILLDFIQKYSEFRDREKMESEGYHFPPIHNGISPENDWYRFECWLKGQPIRKKIKDQLLQSYILKNDYELTDDEIQSELLKLEKLLSEIRFSIALNNNIPPRLVYKYLLRTLNEEYDLINEGSWHLDGCSGYCPECFQRPWCEFGSQSCWQEDEESGKMFLIDSVKRFVSPSSISLQILQEYQADEDKKHKEFEKKQKDNNMPLNNIPLDYNKNDDLTFE